MRNKPICYSVQLWVFVLELKTNYWENVKKSGGGVLFVVVIFYPNFPNYVCTRISMIVGHFLPGEKFVWVGGGVEVNFNVTLRSKTKI